LLSLEPLASIHSLSPLEEGGSIARSGFLYQDHVAARFCIEMVRDTCLLEVWCETEDDITLLWDRGDGIVVEFVQVKANELSQLWSVALLCAGGATNSIIAKSLAHDRCEEPCCFRLVTRTAIQSILKPLLLDRNNGGRCLSEEVVRKLHTDVSNALGDLLSPRGRSVSHWLGDTIWEIGESEESMTNRNRWTLQQYLEEGADSLFTDQLAELYNNILLKVQKAAALKWKQGPEKKKLGRVAFGAWLHETVQRIKGHGPSQGGENLRRKMTEAQLTSAAIATADKLRRAYRTQMLSPKYQQESDLKAAELEATAVLQRLLSNLDAGNLADDGLQFHARCLNSLAAIRDLYPQVDNSFLQGTLYSVADRCRHRFLRAAI
jgi:hypothetical protein